MSNIINIKNIKNINSIKIINLKLIKGLNKKYIFFLLEKIVKVDMIIAGSIKEEAENRDIL